jgi:nickel/cobalt exporter
LALLVTAFRPGSASAHPLGNFTVNQYARIEVSADGPRIVYVLDMAEVPAFQEIKAIDASGDGEIDDGERTAYLDRMAGTIGRALELTVDGQLLTLQAEDASLAFPDGQAGLQLIRLKAVFVPAAALRLNDGDQMVTFVNTYQTDRLGWREIIVTHDEGVTVSGIDLPESDTSRELTAYPDELLGSPLDQTEASFSVRRTPGAAAAPGFATLSSGVDAKRAGTGIRPNGGSTGGRFTALLDGDDLTASGIALALLAAMVWGAAHALSPGHGKTVVGAYLVGSRGTPRHAAFLGLTVTVTHTAGVIALGLVTLFASHYIVPETLFPWLSVGSGVLVVLMGVWTLRMRLRGGSGLGHHKHNSEHGHPSQAVTHTHGGSTHTHLPPAAVSWRGLAALGISGGLIPCPSALVVLLGAIALGRVGFGLALVIAFSVGLAATLTGLGILFLYAGKLLERRMAPGGRLTIAVRYAPAVGSVALTLAGVAIILRALEATSLF